MKDVQAEELKQILLDAKEGIVSLITANFLGSRT